MQAARKLYYYEPQQEASAPEPIVQKRLEKRVKPRNSGLAMQTAFCMVLVFCALVLLLVRYSDLAEQKVNVYQMKAEMKKMELTRDELSASLNKGLDLEAIEKTAVEKLGMQYPSQTQIVYIDKTSLYTLNEPKRPLGDKAGNPVQRWIGSIPWFDKKQAMALNAE